MQTSIRESIRRTAYGKEAERILRNCVHCGFCNATCPTYQLLGDELDGPRGRIYQIKNVLEGIAPSATTQRHLDRCLTCRACETTCPSGVEYGRLLDIGRTLLEEKVPRTNREDWTRRALRLVLPYTNRFRLLLRTGQTLRPLLPGRLKSMIPARQTVARAAPRQHQRRMLLLEGCVQPALQPRINAAAVRIMDRLKIMLTPAPAAGCCGAVSHHLGAGNEAQRFVRANIDAWWPAIEAGAEAIVITATGCAPMVKDYGYMLREDDVYRDKARRVSALARDISEVLANEDLTAISSSPENTAPIVFHSPCTLQHGLQLAGHVEKLLRGLGFTLTEVADEHLCCGSAGTYSILQRDLSRQLRDNKLAALQAGQPAAIYTANIGCLSHLASGAGVPVRHWIELLDSAPE